MVNLKIVRYSRRAHFIGNISPSNIHGMGKIPNPDVKLIMQNNINGIQALLMYDLINCMVYNPIQNWQVADIIIQTRSNRRFPITLTVTMFKKAPEMVQKPIMT